MVSNTVNGKRISAPAGYNSFDYSKKQISRECQIATDEKQGEITAGVYKKSSLGDLFRQVRDFKEKGIPLQDVVIIKAERNQDKER